MRLSTISTTLAAWLLFSTVAPVWADSVAWRAPGPFPDGMDVWFPAGGSAQHDSSLRVGTLTGVEDVTLIRFNLSGLPERANHAYLFLYAMPYAGTSTTPINLSLITGQWHAGNVAAATQPPSTPLGQKPAPTAPGWYALDVTTIYNQWRSAPASGLNFGLRLARSSTTNNRFNLFDSSSSTTNRPELDIYYTPQPTDPYPKLKWPLAIPRSNLKVNLPFAGQSLLTCRSGPFAGKFKEHNGVDYNAPAGIAVYAAEDGIVKESIYDGSGPWAYNIVLEHSNPTGGKFTTVYWHVNPLPEASASNIGGFVPRGIQIATVANLGARTHFHFGVRFGPYVANLSGTGALPYSTMPCDGYQVFPGGFVNPEPGPPPQLSIIFE